MFSRAVYISSVVWLLVITLMQVYNANEQLWHKETQNVKCEKKKNIRTEHVMLETRLVLKEKRRLKRGLIRNIIKARVISGCHPTQISI